MVPPFTLFGFVASQFRNALEANNVKSGTGVADAATRSSWVAKSLQQLALRCRSLEIFTEVGM